MLFRRPDAEIWIIFFSVTEFKLTSDRQYHHCNRNSKDHHLF